MEYRSSNLLDEALGLGNYHHQQQSQPCSLTGKVVLIEDCIETSGAFVLHQLMKRILSPNSSYVVIFLAFAHPFSHYDRILRKLGCNLITLRDSSRFIFFDMLRQQLAGENTRNEGKTGEGGFVALYRKIQKTISGLPENSKNHVTIMIDDVSLMEVAAYGSADHVLDFLHYCHALTSELGCSIVALNHVDIYSSLERPAFILQMEYLADVLVKAEPLATGLAADVHGQLTVLNRGFSNIRGSLKNRISNFHFKLKENSVEYFYPGRQT